MFKTVEFADFAEKSEFKNVTFLNGRSQFVSNDHIYFFVKFIIGPLAYFLSCDTRRAY